MKETKIWKGLPGFENQIEEQANSSEFGDMNVPALSGITESISADSNTGRRDFLKMLGFSLSAAALASCKMPIKKSIPYIFKPEDITPGMANYYASCYVEGGDYVSVLVKTREGRPIMIEGNQQSSLTNGGTSSQAIASLLNLYNTARFTGPKKAGADVSWTALDADITGQLKSISDAAGKIVLLTGTIISPTTKAAIANFKLKYPTAEHIQYDAISYDGILNANEKSFGLRAIPNYRFDQADLIVSVAADFLGTWISPGEFTSGYTSKRKVDSKNPSMSRHIQIESMFTLAGSNADKRIPVSVVEESLSVIALYNLIAAKAGVASVDNAEFSNKDIELTANELWKARGKSLFVCGINDVNTQLLVNGINNMLGNYNSTILWDRPSYQKQGNDAAVANMLANFANVKAVIMAECNPVYSFANGAKFGESLKNTLSIYLGERKNETSENCKYIAPTHNWLESWNDSEPKAGIIGTTQPAISPLFDTRQYGETILKWGGVNDTYYDYMHAYWQTTVLASQTKYATITTLWDNTIQDGEIVCNAPAMTITPNFTFMAEAAGKVKSASSKKGKTQLKLYEKVSIGNGLNADNPWLQEVPDPLSKVTWENYLVTGISDEKYFHNPDHKKFKVANVKVGAKTFSLPVYCMPGIPAGVFAMAYGYGRTITANEEFQRGFNAYSLLGTDLSNVTVTLTGEEVPLACTQIHHLLTHQGLGGMKTRHIIKETTLEDYKKNQASGNVIGEEEPRKEWIAEHLTTLYPGHTYNGHHWKMVIDLNSCTGCNACVVACNAENNVPVVGRDQVIRSREMHWLRIDKYYTGDEQNPQVTFQPMMCQHCDNAPCENVCPVAATNHSTEGINQMAYNRCIGTRYCANNCPYKVRRFNWYDYAGNDSFDKKYHTNNYTDSLGMQEPLVRMVLNPDVTVRSRGVIEKCSMCTQRIQAGKLEAKKAGEPLKDGAIKTACQSACTANAIQFGDYNNKESVVADLINNNERIFGVIEEIHTMPNVMYLTKIRNKKEIDEFNFTESLFD